MRVTFYNRTPPPRAVPQSGGAPEAQPPVPYIRVEADPDPSSGRVLTAVDRQATPEDAHKHKAEWATFQAELTKPAQQSASAPTPADTQVAQRIGDLRLGGTARPAPEPEVPTHKHRRK